MVQNWFESSSIIKFKILDSNNSKKHISSSEFESKLKMNEEAAVPASFLSLEFSFHRMTLKT
jgi:hypothetical protein